MDRLKDTDRGVLEDRPRIDFVEPKVVAVPPKPIPVVPTVNDITAEMAKAKALATAVDVLAAAVQARVDLKAKDMAIDLDPKADAAVIAAMGRMYPDADPKVITYEQYKACKERLRAKGQALADQALQNSNADAVAAARLDISKISPYDDFEGAQKAALYGSKQSKRGGLRPELDKMNQIIEPLDIDEFQDILIRILVNHMWKMFILPVLAPISVPGVISLSDFLPKTIAKYPKGVSVKDLVSKGLPILGEKKPKEQEAPKPDASSIGKA